MSPPAHTSWTDVAVIGAGNIGVCAALYLQQKGFSVRLIDPLAPGEGCAYGNAGVLSAWSCVPQSMPGMMWSVPEWLLRPDGPLRLRPRYLPATLPWLVRFVAAGRSGRIAGIADALHAINSPTVELYRQLVHEAGAADLVQTSDDLVVFEDPAEIDAHAREWALRRERGAELIILKNGEVRDAEPELSPHYRAAVLITRQGHTTNPARLVKTLAGLFLRRGGEHVAAEVLSLRPTADGTTELATTAGPLTAGRVVIAAGAWSRRLTAQLGLKLPLEALRGYHMTFPHPGLQLRNPITEGKRKFVATPMETGLRCAGTVELAGLDAAPNWRRSHVLAALGKRLLPNLDVAEASPWMGHRPGLPDSLPVIGPVPGLPTIYLAFGHGHTGLTAAPMTGRIVAALAAGEPLNMDISPYRADRFA